MTNATTILSIPRAPSLETAWQDVQISFERFCLTAGIAALEQMLREDAERLAGPRHVSHGHACPFIARDPEPSHAHIAHAVPLTLVAGAGHWMIGTVDPHIIVALLVGSLPGIILGSYFAVRVAEPALRLLLAATLIVVAGKLLYDHFENTLSLITAFARRSPH